MNLTENVTANALAPQKSIRKEPMRIRTSAKAGKIIPVAYSPMLREDRVSRGQLRINLDMMETAETLMNAINVTAYAHFIPFLAFERFNGLDQLNRSYKGEQETEGGAVVPFFETITYDRDAEIFKTLGIHAKQGSSVNSAVVEAYNVMVNHRRNARTTKLDERLKDDTTLAQAFWKNGSMNHIVPDFDQAMIDGEVNLKFSDTGLSVGTEGGTGTIPHSTPLDLTANSIGELLVSSGAAWAAVASELNDQGVALSLSNIELAKKTAYFASLRKRYSHLDDDYIIDLLMEGIRVPDAQMSQPVLLDRKSTIVGYARRWATDSGNLDQSVTTGATFIDLNFRTPPMNTGGIVLVTLEIVPEQLFERQKDYFLHATDVESLPNWIRDEGDPEKVSVVKNDHVDIEHSQPTGTFGYAPLNHEWHRDIPRIGGKFMRQIGDPFVEDRQQFWAMETVDPKLTEDFYLVNDLSHSVFATSIGDQFEITAVGEIEIVGLTVSGKGLQENTGDYEAIREDIDDSRVDQTE